MKQDLETTASSSNTSLKTVQSLEKRNMEITPSKEATPERNIININQEATDSEINEPEELETEENNKEKEDENGEKRIETNAKRYKVWIKIHSLKGKNIREKTTYLLDEIKKNKIQWINLSREKNPNEKGIHLSLTFDNEEELQKILKLELETIEINKKVKMTRAPLTRKNTRVAEEILTQKFQIVGNECVRVTTPEIKYADLLKLKETGFAAKALDVPQTINGNRKGLAILNFESQEILEVVVGRGYFVDQHVIKIVAVETKICHQCKSMDYLVKDCQIVKEIKEREFRQKQNYQRFNQTYRKYQPRIYNTLSNRYTNQTNTYAEITRKRGSNFNEQQQSQTLKMEIKMKIKK
ncbi:hypothetical protein Glove_132g274 [Diversispora epigaea]|uniref:Uncharacterized protein n=1 Tax=Diversispora epigaea TaxID=1348612 RepID=A0A397J7M8_9GLOM|nr:hypothetical protein Glove_132g274 [Diversispora epigaea]